MTNGQTYVIIIHVACPIYEILAQLAEHTPFKRRVEGSNPSYLTTTGKRGNHFDFLAFFVDADI